MGLQPAASWEPQGPEAKHCSGSRAQDPKSTCRELKGQEQAERPSAGGPSRTPSQPTADTHAPASHLCSRPVPHQAPLDHLGEA